jgi:hypothetical protein
VHALFKLDQNLTTASVHTRVKLKPFVEWCERKTNKYQSCPRNAQAIYCPVIRNILKTNS